MKQNILFICGLAVLTASSALADPPKLEMPAWPPVPALASETPAPETPPLETLAPETLAPPDYRPWTLGLAGGLYPGLVGGFVSWRFADHFGARTGFGYFQYSDSGLAIADLHYNAKVRLMSEPLILDLYPWKKHSFHISLGVLFNQNELTGTATDTAKILDRVAPITVKITQQPVNPYLSIGGNFFYFDRAHHWAMGGELGVVYTGDPQASLSAGGGARAISDAVWQHEQARVQSWADDFKWFPVLTVNVSYSF